MAQIKMGIAIGVGSCTYDSISCKLCIILIRLYYFLLEYVHSKNNKAEEKFPYARRIRRDATGLLA